jgi:hypothetical protein
MATGNLQNSRKMGTEDLTAEMSFSHTPAGWLEYAKIFTENNYG